MRQNTFILKWNPAISSVSLEDWDFWYEQQDFISPNWSVHEHGKVSPGDEWFMLRVGDGVTGIVAHGVFNGKPFIGEDWRGEGRKRYYIELVLNNVFPHEEPMITTEILENEIPDFDWRGGHSGVEITGVNQDRLYQLKNKYYEEHPVPIYEPERYIGKDVDKMIIGWNYFADLYRDLEKEDPGYTWSEHAFHDMVTLKTEHIYGESTFTFTILLRDKFVLPMICRKLKSIKTDLSDGVCYESYCKIWHDGKCFHINVNDVNVICEELEFGETGSYDKDWINVTI